jgi:hypothetical protein
MSECRILQQGTISTEELKAFLCSHEQCSSYICNFHLDSRGWGGGGGGVVSGAGIRNYNTSPRIRVVKLPCKNVC